MTNILLFVLLFGPLALSYFLKSNAALAFLALCTGFVLLSLTTRDLQQLLDHANIVRVSTDSLGLFLLAGPPLLTLLFTRNSTKGRSQFLFHIIPALCTGAFLALIAIPLLGASFQTGLDNSSIWNNLQKIQSWIIGIGALISLLLVWSSNFKHPKRHK